MCECPPKLKDSGITHCRIFVKVFFMISQVIGGWRPTEMVWSVVRRIYMTIGKTYWSAEFDRPFGIQSLTVAALLLLGHMLQKVCSSISSTLLVNDVTLVKRTETKVKLVNTNQC